MLFFEDEYLEDAVDLAHVILQQRGINDEKDVRVSNVEKTIQEEHAELERRANEPLHWGWKLYCFLIADIIAIIVIFVKSSSGKKRASKEALRFFLLGWLFRVILIGVIETI